MNTYAHKIYHELIDLTKHNEAFYFQDFELEGKHYRIFNYRLASYTDFMQPSATEARGIMFEILKTSDGDKMWRLASHPMAKFWNLNENPLTMNLDLSVVDSIEPKADGSLMSTYNHNAQVRLKSKGSLFSEQAIDAMKFLEQEEQSCLKMWLTTFMYQDYTINLEWVSPKNRIVLGYLEPRLIVLNIRNNLDGSYLYASPLNEYMDKPVDLKGMSAAKFVAQIPHMQDDIEGFIVRQGDFRVKIKTDKYVSLHHAKDSINNPRRLFEAVIDEGVDDLRSMFAYDALAIKQIDEMQQAVTVIYNRVASFVDMYYDSMKDKDRKEYAIGAQSLKYNNISLLSLAMNKYLGKGADYKSFLKARYKELGFRDVTTETTNE